MYKSKARNDFSILKWEFEEPSRLVDFLDLTINGENSRITTKTYQKALNLYQYLSLLSTHPKQMTKGIIFSLM